jgi:hypothetical protein
MVVTISQTWRGDVSFHMDDPIEECVNEIRSRYSITTTYYTVDGVRPEDAHNVALIFAKYYDCIKDKRENSRGPFPEWNDPTPVDLLAYATEAAALKPYVNAFLSNDVTYGTDKVILNTLVAQFPIMRRLLRLQQRYGNYYRTEPTHTFLRTVLYKMRGAIRGEIDPVTLRRTLYAEKHIIEQTWNDFVYEALGIRPTHLGEKYYPTNEEAAWFIAIAFACFDMTHWENDNFIVSYPHWPLLKTVAPDRVDVAGLGIDVVSWVYKNEVLYHISAVGAMQKLSALWAHLVDGSRGPVALKIPKSYWERKSVRREVGAKRYRKYFTNEPLTKSGWNHMIVEHVTTVQVLPGERFIHLVHDTTQPLPDLSRFMHQLRKALTIPLLADRDQEHWNRGCEAGVIVPCDSYGCAAWIIDPDEVVWTKIRVAMARGMSTESTTVDIETHGKANTPELVLAGDDEEAEDED